MFRFKKKLVITRHRLDLAINESIKYENFRYPQYN
jgi:hypothetical protein